MGTRGAIVLVANGEQKAIYNHWDSYPSGLGVEMLNFTRKNKRRSKAFPAEVAALKPVPSTEPTADDFVKYAEFHDPGVDTGKSWYSLLRHTQGDIPATLKAGLFEPSDSFLADSLFCEWAYVIDCDNKVFEVYEGFQSEPHTMGRFASMPSSGGYCPVKLVAAFPFAELPTDAEFLAWASAEREAKDAAYEAANA